MDEPRSKRRFEWLAVVVLAFLIRTGYCVWVNRGPDPFESRYREYIITGQRLLDYKAFLSPLIADPSRADHSALMPPLYTVWVAGVYSIFGIESSWSTVALQVANSLALSLACGLVFCLAHAIGGRRAAWVAGLVAATNPVLIGFTNYIWDTSFFALGVTLTVGLSYRLSKIRFRPVYFFGFGVWLGILALLNPALTLAYPLLVLYPARALTAKRQLLQGVGAALLGWMVAILPWTIRNYVQFEELVYVRSGFMHEVWLGVAPEADRAGADVFRNNFPLNNPEVARQVAEIGENQFLKQRGEQARQAIAADPGRFAKLIFMRTVDYWLGTALTHGGAYGGMIPATRQRQLIMVFFIIEFALIMVAAFRGLFGIKEARWIGGIIFVVSIAYCITHVQVRFRVPVEPLIAVLIGISFAGHQQSTRKVDRQ